MPFVPAPGIVAMATIWKLQNQNCENTFYYRLSGGADAAALTAIAQTYIDWATLHSSFWTSGAGLDKVYMRDLSAADSFSLDVIPDPPVDGTNPGDELPNNVSWAIKRSTGLAGRNQRGRIYWIGMNSDQLADTNHVAPGTANNIVAALNTLLASQASDNGATEVLLHKGTGVGSDILKYSAADLTLDSQRRRLPDHNRHH